MQFFCWQFVTSANPNREHSWTSPQTAYLELGLLPSEKPLSTLNKGRRNLNPRQSDSVVKLTFKQIRCRCKVAFFYPPCISMQITSARIRIASLDNAPTLKLANYGRECRAKFQIPTALLISQTTGWGYQCITAPPGGLQAHNTIQFSGGKLGR